jgi:hypothetical protein
MEAAPDCGGRELLLWLGQAGERLLQERHAPARGRITEACRMLLERRLQESLDRFIATAWTALPGALEQRLDVLLQAIAAYPALHAAAVHVQQAGHFRDGPARVHFEQCEDAAEERSIVAGI